MSFSNQPNNPELVSSAKHWTGQNFLSLVATLGDLVKIQSLAWEGIDRSELRRCATEVSNLLTDINFFDSVEILSMVEGGGAPAVVARRLAKNSMPTVLLYAHHDVQPAFETTTWETAPFEPTLIGDRLYGRGASDDKAGIVTILGAIKMLTHLEPNVNLGVTVFIEGEEEIGSPTFVSFLEQYREKLVADCIVVVDSGNWDLDTPAITTSLRGMVSIVFKVKTMSHPLHSGVYGGAVPDASLAMIKLLATLHDASGEVAVAGLHSSDLRAPDVTEELVKLQAGLLDGVDMIGKKAPLDQIWGSPAITVIGMDISSVAESSNVMQAEMSARISVRVTPGQEPESALAALRTHLIIHAPFGSHLEFGSTESGQSYLAREGGASDLFRQCLDDAYESKTVNLGVGASIPFISHLAEAFPDAEVVVTGVEDPDTRAHAPNESQHLPTLSKAITAHGLFLLHGNRIRPS